VDIKPPSDSLTQNPSLQYFEVSTTSPDDLLKAFQAARPQVVIHSAAIIPPLSERYGRRLEKLVFEVNVEGTRHALAAARQSGCSAFVYTSSCCAVTDDMSVSYINIDERWPVSPVSSIYGESKVRGQVSDLAALITSLGPSRGTSAGSLEQIYVCMRAAPISLVR
jgi:sterol-4alpha-carboxylate 3-dehydrogenase (decarboxylating)